LFKKQMNYVQDEVTMVTTAEKHEELRLALVDAAERAVSRNGPAGIKARDLAKAAGCALGAIYNVFDDLDAVYFAVNSRTFRKFEEFLATREPLDESSSGDPAVDRLVRLALTYFDFAVANEPRWRALFEHRVAQPERGIPQWYLDEQVKLFSLVEAPLGALNPELNDAERVLFARTLFSAVHGVTSLGLDQKLGASPLPVRRNQIAELVRAIGLGLVTQRSSATRRRKQE
jgi:AcrR family transcriptional regulator